MTNAREDAPVRLRPARGEVLVCEAEPGPYTLRVQAGRHEFTADEPQSAGGADRGPNPYELLSAALASCTAMTLRMYARRKGWPVGRISVLVRHERIHARDCEDCESREGRVDVFERVLTIEGPLDEEQKARLLEIADRCPVHRTLTGAVRIRTRLAG